MYMVVNQSYYNFTDSMFKFVILIDSHASAQFKLIGIVTNRRTFHWDLTLSLRLKPQVLHICAIVLHLNLNLSSKLNVLVRRE